MLYKTKSIVYYKAMNNNETNLQKVRISYAMEALSLSAAELSRCCYVDASLINKWRKGSRKITERSKVLQDVASAMLRLDSEGKLKDCYAPYMQNNESAADAMSSWLCGKEIPAMPGRIAPVMTPTSGEYTVQYAVYLGKKGFRKATLSMLDYLLLLPPGQTVTVLCQGQWELFIRNIPFVLQFISKLKKASERGTRLRMINRKGYSLSDSSKFAGYWMTAHLRGYIRSLYYEGEMPPDLRFVGSIPGYWSGRAEEDGSVEDALYIGVYTDPRETRKDEAICEKYAAMSAPSSQYSFFESPLGNAENSRLWQEGSLPLWDNENAALPDGSFNAICRVPGFGIATPQEFSAGAEDVVLPVPRYLFNKSNLFLEGEYYIILCREDVRDGLLLERRRHEVFSDVLYDEIFVPSGILSGQLRRLLKAMDSNENFNVALMPRSAFKKLNIELICYKNSVSVCWLQDMSESVFCGSEGVSGSLHNYVEVVWDNLHKGWMRKAAVRRTLRKWLAGKELDVLDKDSATVLNWEIRF